MIKTTFFAVAVTLASLSAFAQSTADKTGHKHPTAAGSHHDDVKPTKGGVVSVVRDVAYELVATSDSIAIYVTDHGKAVDLKGASAKVTVLTAADKVDVALAPAGDRLQAKGSFKVGAGTKVAAQVTFAGGKMVSVPFTMK